MSLVIADVAGQIDALMRLVDRVPLNEKIILVGDLIDRGHFSFECVEWAIKNRDRVVWLMGNHEHMMLEYYQPSKGFGVYNPDVWEWNGGSATRASYSRNGHKRPPQNHLDWLESLPSYYLSDDKKLLVTHAALHPKFDLESLPVHDNPMHPDFDLSLLWNRGEPVKREYFQVFGHNSHWGLRIFGDEEPWAMCIDQSRSEMLTGFHWPSGELLEEPYLIGPSQEPELSA